MTARALIATGVLLGVGGCAQHGQRVATPRGAPHLLAMHVDAAPLLDFDGKLGALGAVDLEFESAGCCSIGAYAAHPTLRGDEAEKARVTAILDGGLQVGLIFPILDNRFRLRARVGKSGTPPKTPLLGRGGTSGSGALIFRIWNAEAFEPDQAVEQVDAFIGFAHWGFERERTAAGPIGEESLHNAFMFGLRLGVDYGVDFE